MEKSMRKILFVLYIISASISYSQTWTEIEIETGLERECTIISKEQFERLLRQYEEDHEACNFYYYDVLELETASSSVLTESYYILIKRRTFSGIAPALAYGNKNTGRMEIWFSRWFNTKINSEEYKKKFEQLIKRVNGE
jgi:hypothetical protein